MHARTCNYINGTTRTICAAICTNRSHTSRNRFDRIIRKRQANTTDNTLTIWWIQYSLQEDTSHIYRGPFAHSPPPPLCCHLPRHLFSGRRQRVHLLFEQVLSKAEHIPLNVLLPLDVAHVKIERLAVAGAQRGQQVAHILVPELPLVRREVLQALDGLEQLVLDPLHTAKCKMDCETSSHQSLTIPVTTKANLHGSLAGRSCQQVKHVGGDGVHEEAQHHIHRPVGAQRSSRVVEDAF